MTFIIAFYQWPSYKDDTKMSCVKGADSVAVWAESFFEQRTGIDDCEWVRVNRPPVDARRRLFSVSTGKESQTATGPKANAACSYLQDSMWMWESRGGGGLIWQSKSKSSKRVKGASKRKTCVSVCFQTIDWSASRGLHWEFPKHAETHPLLFHSLNLSSVHQRSF